MHVHNCVHLIFEKSILTYVFRNIIICNSCFGCNVINKRYILDLDLYARPNTLFVHNPYHTNTHPGDHALFLLVIKGKVDSIYITVQINEGLNNIKTRE